jgi:hypothetical protein
MARGWISPVVGHVNHERWLGLATLRLGLNHALLGSVWRKIVGGGFLVLLAI